MEDLTISVAGRTSGRNLVYLLENKKNERLPRNMSRGIFVRFSVIICRTIPRKFPEKKNSEEFYDEFLAEL